MYQGRILKSGGKELADKLDEDDLVAKWLSMVSTCSYTDMPCLRRGTTGC